MPHPAYRLGWSRVSCLACIFGLADQWASIRAIAPDTFNRVADLETAFGKTIKHNQTVTQLADKGTPYPACNDAALVALALSTTYTETVTCDPAAWTLPAGAFRHSGGPN